MQQPCNNLATAVQQLCNKQGFAGYLLLYSDLSEIDTDGASATLSITMRPKVRVFSFSVF
jgi:hypothetical protein